MLKKKKVLNELIEQKENFKQQHADYPDFIEFGDYTYGKPAIHFWDDKTKVKIGKFCSIADGVTILAGGEHKSDWISTYPFNALIDEFRYIKGHPATKGNIIIGNDVWIGNNAKILSGVTIGDGAIIGSNALVCKDVPPYSIVGGNPAKLIKYRFDQDTIDKLLKVQWWNCNEETLIKIIPILQSQDLKKLFKYFKK